MKFNYWELNYLQATLNRWYDYKGAGVFSDAEVGLVRSIRTKVQVTDGTEVSFSPEENKFLQSLFYVAKQDYGRGSGRDVFDANIRLDCQQRTVQIAADILAKLRGEIPPIVNPGPTEALES